jgi:small subunit ribosomal protein S29
MGQSLRRRGGAMGGATGLTYKRPPVKTYTDACEAPRAMWDGAIPVRKSLTINADKTRFLEDVKTYSHPAETSPTELGFDNINAMYCMSNDELVAKFQEGVPGRTSQLFPPSHPRGFLYRKQSHLINQLLSKLPYYSKAKGGKAEAISALLAGRPGLIFDGPTGTGKSALMMQAAHFARSRGILTVFVPNAKDWTHGEWAWPSTVLPGFWDAPDATRRFLAYFARSERAALKDWSLRKTPELPCESGEEVPKTLLDLCVWGSSAPAPSSVDRQSVAIKFVMDELMAETERPIAFVVDGMNLFSGDTHFRLPHPDFLRTLTSLDAATDVDLYPQELPRIPAARFTFVRALNKMMLDQQPNRVFITGTTRDFKPFDGGVSGFPNVEKDRHANSLDEYAPFHPEKDSVLHPMKVGDFDEYEYRSFLRYIVNSGELAGLGWGPLWHYSSSFERKHYKIDFLSQRNPQRVIDHYHQELTWSVEYERIRQKQAKTQDIARNEQEAFMGRGRGGNQQQ